MHNDRGPISTRFVRLSLRATVTPISGGNPPGKSGDREKSLSSRIGGSPFRFHARTSRWWDAGYETERDRERESFSLVAVTAMFQRISMLRGARSLPCVIDVTARRSFLSFASTVFPLPSPVPIPSTENIRRDDESTNTYIQSLSSQTRDLLLSLLPRGRFFFCKSFQRFFRYAYDGGRSNEARRDERKTS